MTATEWYDERPVEGRSEERSEYQELREELDALKSAVGGRLDAAEDIAVAEARRAQQEEHDRAVKAASAANDPATIEALRNINSPEELERFMREHGWEPNRL